MKRIIYILKWLFNKAKHIMPYLVMSLILGSFLSVLNVYRAIIIKDLIDAAVEKELSALIWAAVFFLISIIIDMIISSVTLALSNFSSTKLLNKLQNDMYAHITYSTWKEQSKFHSGEFLTRLNSDAGTVNSFIVNTIPSVISALVLFVTSFYTLLRYEPALAIIALFLTPICIIISRKYSKKYGQLQTENQQNESKYLSHIQESIQNSIIIKTFCMEKSNIETLGSIQQKRINLSLSRSSISIKSNFVINLSAWIGSFLTFLFGAIGIFRGAMSFGTSSALFQLVINLQGPFYTLIGAIPQSTAAAVSIKRIIEIEEMELEKTDDNERTVTSTSGSVGIKFEEVDFSYNRTTNILEKISFEIMPGETIALMGMSGEGKTTLIRLILALIRVQSGKVYLASENELVEINSQARNLISYVPQGNILFSGTIEDNLRFGNQEAGEQELEEVLLLSCAWEFVNKLENGIKTVIGEKGFGLSEGQVQRLAIARALLRNKPVLILDEVTSALDSETEKQVLENIHNLKRKPTCIIISHRTSAIDICNRVFKLSNRTLEEIDNFSREVASETA
jgi:ABC-type multidrug transport system fused ATPase/permease subunit